MDPGQILFVGPIRHCDPDHELVRMVCVQAYWTVTQRQTTCDMVSHFLEQCIDIEVLKIIQQADLEVLLASLPLGHRVRIKSAVESLQVCSSIHRSEYAYRPNQCCSLIVLF